MWLGYPNAIVLEWRQKRQGIPQVCFKKKKKSKRKRSVPRKLYTQLNKKGRTSRLSASNQATSESSTRAGVFLSLSARMCVCRCVCVCVHDYRFNNVLWLEARAKILGSTIITNAIMDSRRNSSSSKYQRDPFFWCFGFLLNTMFKTKWRTRLLVDKIHCKSGLWVTVS